MSERGVDLPGPERRSRLGIYQSRMGNVSSFLLPRCTSRENKRRRAYRSKATRNSSAPSSSLLLLSSPSPSHPASSSPSPLSLLFLFPSHPLKSITPIGLLVFPARINLREMTSSNSELAPPFPPPRNENVEASESILARDPLDVDDVRTSGLSREKSVDDAGSCPSAHEEGDE